MRVSVVGLGCVGVVTAACLAAAGHEVCGVDISEHKVQDLCAGRSPIAEPGLAELVCAGVATGLLTATTVLAQAVVGSDVIIFSVGTPSENNGDTSLRDLTSALAGVARVLDPDRFTVLVVTSTVPPGSLEAVFRPLVAQSSGLVEGIHFSLCCSPEFLREGTAIADFREAEKTVIGVQDARGEQVLVDLYGPFAKRAFVTAPEVAETVKFVDNAWHALKVSFANEVGRFCDSQGIDSFEVMRIFKSDTKLNISASYLEPGFAFGGSCLPKDLRSLVFNARARDVKLPVLESVLASNAEHLALAVDKICRGGAQRVLMLGLAFKFETDDLRESPSVALARALLDRACMIKVYDEHVPQAEHLDIGAGSAIPMGVQLVPKGDLEDAVVWADTLVITQRNPAFGTLSGVRGDHTVVDLVGIGVGAYEGSNYIGLTW